jgi:hypothetical protein
MAIPKSLKSKEFLFLLLVAFLAAILAEGPDDIGFGLGKVKAIRAGAQFSDSDAEGDLGGMRLVPEKALPDPEASVRSPLSSYFFISLDSWNPGEAHLLTKADRAPPEIIS